MKRKIDMTEFVTLAVSKDEFRYGLTEVYRDKTELVATDGHRLHWIGGLPEVAPHYPSGATDKEFFPPWRTIADSVAQNRARSITIMASEPKLATLKSLLAYGTACAKLRRKDKKSDYPCIVHVSTQGKSLKLELDGGEASWTSDLPVTDDCPKFGINLSYFIDALWLLTEGGCAEAVITLPKPDKDGQIVEALRVDYPGTDYHAVIMPVRMPTA